MVGLVGDIARINGLFVDSRHSDFVKSVRNRQLLRQRNKLGRHYASRAVLRIFQNLVDVLPRLSVRLREQSFYHGRGHFLDKIDGVVDKHIIHNAFKFLIRELCNQVRLNIRRHLDKSVCRHIFLQQTERYYALFTVKILKNFRNINAVHIAKQLFETLESLVGYHLLDFVGFRNSACNFRRKIADNVNRFFNGNVVHYVGKFVVAKPRNDSFLLVCSHLRQKGRKSVLVHIGTNAQQIVVGKFRQHCKSFLIVRLR